jgi:ArsR family transcriptional regulator, arsenate/arsenite/antimonite-responsive transcriptional repressor
MDHGPLSAAPVRPEQAAAIAALLGAVADASRVLILSELLHAPGGELNARDIESKLELRQPTVSHHLGKLVKAGILQREQRGPYAYFRVAPDALDRIAALFTAGDAADQPGR